MRRVLLSPCSFLVVFCAVGVLCAPQINESQLGFQYCQEGNRRHKSCLENIVISNRNITKLRKEVPDLDDYLINWKKCGDDWEPIKVVYLTMHVHNGSEHHFITLGLDFGCHKCHDISCKSKEKRQYEQYTLIHLPDEYVNASNALQFNFKTGAGSEEGKLSAISINVECNSTSCESSVRSEGSKLSDENSRHFGCQGIYMYSCIFLLIIVVVEAVYITYIKLNKCLQRSSPVNNNAAMGMSEGVEHPLTEG